MPTGVKHLMSAIDNGRSLLEQVGSEQAIRCLNMIIGGYLPRLRPWYELWDDQKLWWRQPHRFAGNNYWNVRQHLLPHLNCSQFAGTISVGGSSPNVASPLVRGRKRKGIGAGTLTMNHRCRRTVIQNKVSRFAVDPGAEVQMIAESTLQFGLIETLGSEECGERRRRRALCV